MRASDVSAALTAIIPTKRPTYLWGAPGVGKSSIVRQATQALGIAVIDVRAVLLDPVDLRGIPAVNGDHRAHWCQPDFLPRDGQGVLFLDELAQAPPLVQSACLQLTLDRKIGEYTLPEGWTVIAASNRQEDRAGAHKLISPLLNRFVHLDLEVSVDDWQTWALTAGIEGAVTSFIRFRPGLLFKFDPAAGQRAFPTPRSWEFVSQVTGVTPDALQFAVVSGCVGEGPAAEFIAHRKMYTQLPDVDDILVNPTTYKVPGDPAILYATIGAIVEKARKADAGKLSAIAQYAGRMAAEFGTLLMRDTMAVAPKFSQLPAVAAWCRQNAHLFT